MKDEQNGLLLQVEGNIAARSYKELQSNFESLIQAMKKTNELELTNQVLNLKDKSFKMELKWKI
jgi:hypothetical protein